MSRPAFVLAAMIAAQPVVAGGALASAGMACDALDGSGDTVEMNLPRSAGSPPNWVRVGIGDKLYSSLPVDEKAVPITLRQSFEDDDSFYIDLTEEPGGDASILIRLLRADNDEGPVWIGYVQFTGRGVTPIKCLEDE